MFLFTETVCRNRVCQKLVVSENISSKRKKGICTCECIHREKNELLLKHNLSSSINVDSKSL